MKRFSLSMLAFVVTSFCVLNFVASPAKSCPFCPGPSLTLTEQVAQADAAVLVKWLSSRPPTLSDPGLCELEVVDVDHQPDGSKLAERGKIKLTRHCAGKVGDHFMLFGTSVESTIEWGAPLAASKTAYFYIRNAPKLGAETTERLQYFLKYLEASDKLVADDAFGEFANAAYADVAKMSGELPRLKLRKWLTSKEVSTSHLGLYGMLLGLCGTDEDAPILEAKITEETDEIRIGIDGVMGGYLLLTGEKGLKLLEETKLTNKKAPFAETYAALQAVRFMWQYGDGRISPDRLRQSMRLMLDRPELADLIIADLSRMKDWSVQDKLMSSYDQETSSTPIKRAIVRYILSSIKDTAGATGSEDETKLPQHVVKGQQYLKELEVKDPKTVNQAKPLTRPRVGGVRD